MKPKYTEGTDTKNQGKEDFKQQQAEVPESGNELGVSERKEKNKCTLRKGEEGTNDQVETGK